MIKQPIAHAASASSPTVNISNKDHNSGPFPGTTSYPPDLNGTAANSLQFDRPGAVDQSQNGKGCGDAAALS
ncbi:hypothetical protein [Bradyrhizobium cenepequi]